MKSKKFLIVIALAVLVIAVVAATAVAAPLPNGTKLSVIQGTGSAFNHPCDTGSCFSMEVNPGLLIWTDIGPGTDGGIIVGKDQAPGGQEGPGGGQVTTPGELTAAWNFFTNNGCNATKPFCGASAGCVTTGASANLFDDTSCLGAPGCLGRTALGSWHVAWNGVAVPMGSALGCKALDTTKCQGVIEMTLTPSPAVSGSTYVLRHYWAVPNGDASGFGNVPYSALLRGTVTLPCSGVVCDDNNPCTDDSCNPATSQCVFTPNTAPCSDNNACTTGDVCSNGSCQPGAPANCDDNNLCTTDTCDPSTGCVHTPKSCPTGQTCDPAIGNCIITDLCAGVNCDDNNICTTDSCDPATGACVHTAANNGAPCDDGNACTVNDVCSGGACSGTSTAACSLQGRFLIEAGSYFCMGNTIDPPTNFMCKPLAAGFDGGFLLGHYQPMQLMPNVCNNGPGGTGYSFIADGSRPKAIVNSFSFFNNLTFFSTNPISWQSCNPHDAPSAKTGAVDGNGCKALIADMSAWEVYWNSAVFEQGPRVGTPANPIPLLATGKLCPDNSYELNWPALIIGGPFNNVTGYYLLRGHFNPCDIATCDDGNVCTDDAIDLTACQCTHTPNTRASCDGNPCTTGDHCSNGTCITTGTTPTDCNDNNPCTIDNACDPATAVGCVHTPKDCNDNNPCTTDSCDVATGNCVHTNVNDGIQCSPSDNACMRGSCLNGTCQSQTPVNCDDNNPCTDDSCDPVTSCVHINNTASCTPAPTDLCYIGNVCSNGHCGTPKTCSADGNPCTDDICDYATGNCIHPNSKTGTSCFYGNACMAGDFCSNGSCQPGTLVINCSDRNFCTTDTCDPATGCVHTPISCPTGQSCNPATGNCVPAITPSKIGVFSNGNWYLDANQNWAWDGTPTDILNTFGTGVAGAIPVVGDWNGDGKTKVGIFVDGVWYLDMNGNGQWDGEGIDVRGVFGLGLPNAIPVTGDWNGDGITEIGIYSDGNWYLDKNRNWAWDGTPTDTFGSFGVGLPNAIPVTGDWNGDGTTEIGIYSDGNWFLDTNRNWAWDGTPTDTRGAFGFGLPNAIPVTGDWNGDGITKIGIYSDGNWFLDTNKNWAWDGMPPDTRGAFGFGLPNAVPVVGKW